MKNAPHPVDVHVGLRLRAARNLKGLSQEMVAKAVDLTFQQIQKYEKASNRVSAGKLIQFALLFEQPVEWFFEGAPGYGADETKPNGRDIAANFFALPYARDVATDYVAIAHNANRQVVAAVARALASKEPVSR